VVLSPSQRKAHKKYFDANYTQVKLSMPNAEAEALAAHCKEHGYTKAGFIRAAIKEKMERDNAATPPPPAGDCDCGDSAT
jgi:hypothetical protein